VTFLMKLSDYDLLNGYVITKKRVGHENWMNWKRQGRVL
jgi:hypothetical protein